MDALLKSIGYNSEKFEAYSTDENDILDFFKNEDSRPIAATMSNPKHTRVFTRFVGTYKWYTRIWVVQELAVASADPAIYLGNHRWGWQRLSTFCSVLIRAMWATGHGLECKFNGPAALAT